MFTKKVSTLVGSSVLATGFAVTSSLIAPEAQAFTVTDKNGNEFELQTDDPNCSAAVDVFNPLYDRCAGAFLLTGGNNDVTDGSDDNIVNQLLNEQDIFGTEDWTFLAKQDNAGSNQYFTVNFGSSNTEGTIELNTTNIENDFFGPTFTENYDVAISFKAANNFSIYGWDAALGTNTIEWSTSGTATNKQGITQGLSHASVYVRYKAEPKVRVPEPTSVLALGLIGGGMFLSRRKNS